MKIKRFTYADGGIAYASEGTEVKLNKQNPIKVEDAGVFNKEVVKELKKKLKEHEDKKPKDK